MIYVESNSKTCCFFALQSGNAAATKLRHIWKKKGDQADLNNDRGIFNVVKIRSILDKLIYNDIYNLVDKSMSSSNIGARKNRNIRDHLFVINGILNDTITSSNKQPLDLQIYDVSKCFDKLDFTNTANDLYKSGVLLLQTVTKHAMFQSNCLGDPIQNRSNFKI